jgi:ATP-dependent DNA helicase RecQ
VAEEAVEEGVIEAVRMVLSGVARTESRFACGKNLIAQMLCGSNSAKIKKLRLNQLSTFGLLWQLKQTEVVTLIDLLIAIGCLEQEDIDRFRPVLRLTPLGGDVMRGKADLPAGLKLPGELRLKLRRPAARDSSPVKAGGQRSEAGGQRSEVRDQRSGPQPASPPQNVQPLGQAPNVTDYERPPEEESWIIGSMDADLAGGDPYGGRTDCQSVPRGAPVSRDTYDRGQARAPCTHGRPDVQGVIEGGPGDSFETAQEVPLEAAKPPLVDAAPEPAAINRPSYYWTWRLLAEGFQAEECLAIRGIAREALLDHVCQAAENGHEIRLTWCLSAETIAALENVIGDNRPKQIRPLLTQLPPGTLYQEVQIYLKCRPS